jgi:heme-degrading monooxygenase HmoA
MEFAVFSVIFEVLPKRDRFSDYLELAGQLKPILERIDGFVDNERFESRRRPGWLLSHSTWRDEKAVVRWRTVGEHHMAQARGRSGIFSDYHLRVGDVARDTHPPPQAPIREERFDETQTGVAKWVTLTEWVVQEGAPFAALSDRTPEDLGLNPGDAQIVDHDTFSSIYTPGKLALLVAWRTRDGATGWRPSATVSVKSLRHRIVRIVRDYGMFDRREAPQYYPDVPRADRADY